MSRRKSASTTTRLVQVLFAVFWIGMLIYMVWGYMKNPANDSVASNEPGTETQAGVGESEPGPGTTSPDVSTLNDSTTVGKSDSGPAAKKILDTALATYRNATGYSDQGFFEVSWQVEGRPRFVEQYPCSMVWRKDGRLQANIFDTKIRSNGNLLSCFVSEIRTENLKNQQLFIKGPQLVNQLYRDKIAAYYLNGGERIPVNELVIPNTTLLAPPAMSLLTGETVSPWFGSVTQPQLLGEEKLDAKPFTGEVCHVLKCPSPKGQLIAWVDKQNAAIRKIKLPNTFLDPMLAADAKVRDLAFYVKFPGASFDANTVAFEEVLPRKGVWPVREFVVPANPLPTNLVGTRAPEFKLVDQKRTEVSSRQLQGKPTVMLLVDGGESDAELIQKFDAARKNIASNGYNFLVVAGPRAVQRSANGSWAATPSIQPALNRTNVALYADLDGLAAKSLELASLPAVVLLNSRLNIQYADSLEKTVGFNGKLAVSQKWDQDLVAAISAQNKGIDVAGDMQAKYRSYLDKYFKDRDERLVASWFPTHVLPNQRKVAAVPVNVRREQSAQRAPVKLNPRLIWESTRLKSPGNIAMVPDANRNAKALLILDGWQTVSLFSLEGTAINQKRLQLPEGVAVTSIRPLVSDRGTQHFAMFTVGGRQVFLFDATMELVGAYPKKESAAYPILACEVLPGSAGRSDELLICFGGVGGGVRFDSFGGKASSIGETAVRALALSGSSVLAADERTGALLAMSDNGRSVDARKEYNHIASGASGMSSFAATGLNASREWSLVLLDQKLQIRKSFPIASAVFENGLEPVSGVSIKNSGYWAVADNSNRIYLLSDAGVWMGDMAAEGRVSGLKLMRVEGRTRLIVSTDRKVECWELNFAPDRVGAIGGRPQ